METAVAAVYDVGMATVALTAAGALGPVAVAVMLVSRLPVSYGNADATNPSYVLWSKAKLAAHDVVAPGSRDAMELVLLPVQENPVHCEELSTVVGVRWFPVFDTLMMEVTTAAPCVAGVACSVTCTDRAGVGLRPTVTALVERVTSAEVPLPAGVAVITPADTDLLPASKSSCRHVQVGSKPKVMNAIQAGSLLGLLAHRAVPADLLCQHIVAHLVNACV